MMTETRPLYVRLNEDLHRRLKLAAVHRDKPMSELVRHAILEYLDRTEVDRG